MTPVKSLGGGILPGAGARLAERLAKKGINIDCAYAAMPKGAKKAVVLLATSKPDETAWA